MPPADLYKPLARFSISVGESGETSGHISFELSGTYDVTVDLTSECLPYRVEEFSTPVRFVLKQGEAILFDKTSEIPRDPHRVCQFEIPDSAPLRQMVEYTLKIVEGNAAFESVCGPVRFQIKHASVK